MSRRVRVFQVAYDRSLLIVRAEMLKHAGLEVASALGNDEARRALEQAADYDLVLVAWSAPDAVRREMVVWVKLRYPQIRVMALYSATGRPIAEADFNSASERPEEWFTAVRNAAVA